MRQAGIVRSAAAVATRQARPPPPPAPGAAAHATARPRTAAMDAQADELPRKQAGDQAVKRALDRFDSPQRRAVVAELNARQADLHRGQVQVQERRSGCFLATRVTP